MQTRWMLYMERGETLQLLPGVPRAYFEDGKHIEIHGAASYFGPVSSEDGIEIPRRPDRGHTGLPTGPGAEARGTASTASGRPQANLGGRWQIQPRYGDGDHRALYRACRSCPPFRRKGLEKGARSLRFFVRSDMRVA